MMLQSAFLFASFQIFIIIIKYLELRTKRKVLLLLLLLLLLLNLFFFRRSVFVILRVYDLSLVIGLFFALQKPNPNPEEPKCHGFQKYA